MTLKTRDFALEAPGIYPRGSRVNEPTPGLKPRGFRNNPYAVGQGLLYYMNTIAKKVLKQDEFNGYPDTFNGVKNRLRRTYLPLWPEIAAGLNLGAANFTAFRVQQKAAPNVTVEYEFFLLRENVTV